MIHNRTVLQHCYRHFSTKGESGFVYVELREAIKQVADVGGDVLRSKPIQVPYKLMGGGVVNFFVGKTWGMMRAVTGAMDWTAEKVTDGGRWAIETGKEAALGTGQAVLKSTAWNLGMGVARTIKMNLWDVGIASAQTGIEAVRQSVKAPFEALLKIPYEAAQETIGQVRGALKHFFTLNWVESARNTRDAIFATLKAPLQSGAALVNGAGEVLSKAKETAAIGVRSYLQFIMNTKDRHGGEREGMVQTSIRDVREGASRVIGSPQQGYIDMQQFKAMRAAKEQERLAKKAEEAEGAPKKSGMAKAA